MKISLSRDAFLSALKATQPATQSSSPVTEHRCLLISVEGGSVTFGTAGDVIGIRHRVDAAGREDGQALIDHKALTERVSVLPLGGVELTVAGKDKGFKGGIRSEVSKRKGVFTALDPDGFPPVLRAEASKDKLGIVSAKILGQAAAEVGFAIEPSRVNGALLSPDTEKFFDLVSMGGYALAQARGWFQEIWIRDGVLLPAQILGNLSIFKDGDVELSYDATRIYVENASTLLMVSRLQTSFPPWKTVLTASPKTLRFQVDSSAFLETVKAVAVGADSVEGSERFVQIDVQGKDGVITVSTQASERSRMDDELQASSVEPGEFLFHVDMQRLSAAIRACEPGEIRVFFDHGNEIMLRTETFTGIVMLIQDVRSR